MGLPLLLAVQDTNQIFCIDQRKKLLGSFAEKQLRLMKEKIKNLTEAFTDLERNLLPKNFSSVVHGIHLGMFTVHGHRIDELKNIIQELEEEIQSR